MVDQACCYIQFLQAICGMWNFRQIINVDINIEFGALLDRYTKNEQADKDIKTIFNLQMINHAIIVIPPTYYDIDLFYAFQQTKNIILLQPQFCQNMIIMHIYFEIKIETTVHMAGFQDIQLF